MSGDVTGKTDPAAVQGDGIAFDGDDAVAGCGQRHDELAVTGAHDGDGGRTWWSGRLTWLLILVLG